MTCTTVEATPFVVEKLGDMVSRCQQRAGLGPEPAPHVDHALPAMVDADGRSADVARELPAQRHPLPA